MVGTVVGAGRSQANLETALARGVIDVASQDLAAAVSEADVVVVATALAATESVLKTIAPQLKPNAVVTDVGSAKACVQRWASAALGNAATRFVAGHPIAGTENSGAGAAFATLYRNHRVVLTPQADTDRAALGVVRDMWQHTGAEVVEMDAQTHDKLLAATSHLPHMVAYNLVETLAGRGDAAELFDFAAGGFRDFTRIASSSPTMWTEIVLANREAVLAACRDYAEHFSELINALENNNAAALEQAFSRAKQTRDSCLVPESNEP